MPLNISKISTEPIFLEPDNFTDHMWGGDWIPRFKGMAPKRGQTVGESWEFSTRPERPTNVNLPDGQRHSLRELVQRFPREILGPRFTAPEKAASPILIKFIDAKEDLSLQVHPDDAYARLHEKDSGKSEAWVILETEKSSNGGFIYLGFDEAKASDYASADDFQEAFFDALHQANAQGPSLDRRVREKAERLILPFLNKIPVRPGEVYELRPGAIHAIGHGVRLFEIQEASDLTYRVWDWNRPAAKKMKERKLEFRPLHLEKARDVLDFYAKSPKHYRQIPAPRGERDGVSEEVLIVERDKRFAAHLHRFHEKGARMQLKPQGLFQVLTVIKGSVEMGRPIRQGHSVLLPACMGSVDVRALEGGAEVIRSYVPI